MAWYYGTFSCGHEGRVNIIGPTKFRQFKADRKFSGLCPECYEKHIQEERKKATKVAEEKAKEMELQELTGTEKQIAWANTLRQKLIDKSTKVIDQQGEKIFLSEYDRNDYERRIERLKREEERLANADTEDKKERCIRKINDIKEILEEQLEDAIDKADVVAVLDYILNTFNASTFYIDTRDYTLNRFIEKYKNEALKTDEEKLIEQHEKDLEDKAVQVQLSDLKDYQDEFEINIKKLDLDRLQKARPILEKLKDL